MEESDDNNDYEPRRPPGLTLLGGLYLFFFLITISGFGQPIPFFGAIYQGRVAEMLVYLDSILCLYIFLGLIKRQRATWYLLLGYNLFQLSNTGVNLIGIAPTELEKILGSRVDHSRLVSSNLTVMVAIVLLTVFIFRQRSAFTNRSLYLFK